MSKIYAPMRATVSVPIGNGKTKSRTVLIESTTPAGEFTTAIECAIIIAGIVDTLPKGYHVASITEDDNGDMHVSAVKVTDE